MLEQEIFVFRSKAEYLDLWSLAEGQFISTDALGCPETLIVTDSYIILLVPQLIYLGQSFARSFRLSSDFVRGFRGLHGGLLQGWGGVGHRARVGGRSQIEIGIHL